MEKFIHKYGQWAIVAGAAEGLGEAFSESLSKLGMNLIMVDYQHEKMEILARQLESAYGIKTKCVYADLKDKKSVSEIMDCMPGLDCRLLIYVAAFSRVKPFLSLHEDELDSFLQVNCSTQLHLIQKFSKSLTDDKKGGGIVLMSSLSGLMGVPLVATYAASKAFTWNLAESLQHELKKYDIDIMSCIAGVTSTPTFLSTDPKFGKIPVSVLSPEKVVDNTLANLGKKTLYIPGFSNRLNYFILTRLLPRRFAAKIANIGMGKMYPGIYKHL